MTGRCIGFGAGSGFSPSSVEIEDWLDRVNSTSSMDPELLYGHTTVYGHTTGPGVRFGRTFRESEIVVNP